MRNFSQKLLSDFAGKIGLALLMVLCFALITINAQTPTTIVNYDFNGTVAGTPCAATPISTAPNVSSTITTSTGTCSTDTGIATTAAAFTQNSTAGTAVTITNFASAQSVTFQLGGSGLTAFSDYQVYFQASRNNQGPTTATLQYSTDGTNFTTFGSPVTITTGFTAFTFDLSAIGALDNVANVFFRIAASAGQNNVGILRVDNFQVQAVAAGPTAAGVSLSGRVATDAGQGIGRAKIMLTGGALTEPVFAVTDFDGNYSFEDIPAGGTYFLSISVKGYKFDRAIVSVNLNEEVTDAHFTGTLLKQRIRTPIE